MFKLVTIRLISVVALAVLLGSMLAACAPAISDGGETDATATPNLEVPIGNLAVYVPAGHFYMGSDPEIDPLAEEDELPLHNILLPGYFIYRNEVSNGFYKQCVAAGVCSEPQMFDEPPSTHYVDPAYDQYPVVGVNWEQASTFCGWAEARLPTEAEWEKAARGQLGNYYPWGDDEPSCDLNNMEGCITDPPDTDEIGQHPEGESFYEADDMAGNVWEWTADIYNPEYYQDSPEVNPAGPESGDLRTVRGGSFDSSLEDLRSSARMGLDPNEAFNNVGFRCVPMGEQAQALVSAPFCQPSYTQLCRDPNGGDGSEDCTPPTTQGGEPGDYDLTGFGCKDANGQVTVTIDGPIGDDNTVNVGGYDFNCVESGIPDRWLCTGPHPVEGTLTTITVCPDTTQGANNRNSLVVYQPAAEGPAAPQLQGVTPTPDTYDQLVAFDNSKAGSGDQLVAYQPQTAIVRSALQAYEPPSGGAPSLVAYQ
ncbi:MAG: SUMF1/EgtB/PvdO family nonheme iron enzyme, partial [Candidatus Aminicenantales bacterium]